MRIAVVGSGISGLAAAWLLSREHQVALYEAERYLGGHTHTHRVAMGGTEYAVDSGFIVYNTQHYPLLDRLFGELQVRSQPTSMSFAVRHERSGLEYNGSSLRGLFCQPRNLLSPRFLGMLRDLLRFYREAPGVLGSEAGEVTLGDYLAAGGYGDAFRDDHLVPMAAALWSCPPQEVLAFPVRHLVQFMANHQMLQVAGRPRWRVLQGGSSRYVAALRSRWSVEEHIGEPARAVRRTATHVELTTDMGVARFDRVILACHSDRALALLADPSTEERQILGAIRYHRNEAALHTDTSVLPSARATWAAWNVLVSMPDDRCIVSYCMNLLQGLQSPEPFIVSLNAGGRIAPERVLRRMTYEHPVFSRAAVAAQKRKTEIQGRRRTWYAGAYWGWGFHEDGIRSAVEIARAFGIDWPTGRGTSALPASWSARAA